MLVLAPAVARAQTNIDQGKSPAELFAGDCATCHKSARGLANGRGSAALAGFLIEHYTASRDQAAALAAYVLGAGGGQPAPVTQGRAPKTPPDKPDRASTEEPKPSARSRERARQEENSATARTREEQRKGEGSGRIMQEPNGPDRRVTPGRREPEPAMASPNRQAIPEPAPATPAPAPVPPAPVVVTPAPPTPATAAAPAPAAAPSRESSAPATTPGPSAAVPAVPDSGEGGAVPRDNIPD